MILEAHEGRISQRLVRGEAFCIRIQAGCRKQTVNCYILSVAVCI